ncbi:WD40-repeat-containing domain protein [Suillus paluster]|uniref:WD40-repeat-containing domain protein n=1 Tax=Suillus paluster TaxID=48578 RepID=UPI001B8863B6|nr:WD40-repeat-containing domain protein [Suillus paluster]KAG1745019.1 WD40-repeat-containing domain protein [Suillus paluster]
MVSESPAKETLEDASTPAQSKRPTPKHKFEGHEETISNFIFLHDNIHIVSGSLDCMMYKWDSNTGLPVGEPWAGEGGYIDALSLSPDGKTIACGREVRSLSWSPSGDHLASGSNDGTILVRKAKSGEIELGLIETKQGRVFALAYSPSGEKIASGGDTTICVWDTKTGLLVVGPIEELAAYVTSVVWSLDNSRLYAASDKFVRIFDSNSGMQLHHFESSFDWLETIRLQQRPKRSFFARHTGPEAVTVSPGRRKQRIYVAPPPPPSGENTNTNALAGQSSSAEQPHAKFHVPQHTQNTQTQSDTQLAQEDCGCLGNFCLALCIA